MASDGYYSSQAQDQGRSIIAKIKTLTVADLKALLRHLNLTVGGVKTELQLRVIASIEKAQNASDTASLEMVRRHLGLNGFAQSPSYPSPYSNHTPTTSASPQFSSPTHRAPPHPSAYSTMGPGRNLYDAAENVYFKDSPFYKIVRPVSKVQEMKVRETTRDASRVSIHLPPDVAVQIQKDNRNRVMVFCSADNFGYKASDISFPYQVELKCNGQEVKANLRGLKNKPGSTRPADITHLLHKRNPTDRNEVELVYALTKQKFWMVVNYVTKKPVEELVKELKQGKALSKESVLREMQKEAADPDIEVSSRVVSLKCPLSYTRIQVPCRGMGCKHNQCFDATSYLQLQEQAPTWTCPQCNKAVPWEQLVLDHYILDILNSTDDDTEQVTVEPDGKWHLGQFTSAPTNTRKRKANATPDTDDDDADDDDDDLVILDTDQPAMNGVSLNQILTPSSVRTPPVNGRESSVATTHRSASKRPRQEVIDLTLSDDDDEDPRPPVKSRPSFPTSAYSSSSNYVPGMTPYSTRLPGSPLSSSSITNQQPQPATNNTSSSNRYQFHLPPPPSPHPFNFTNSFGSSSNNYGGYGPASSTGF